MSKLLIIYHSRTGGTRQMVEAAFRAAQAETQTVLQRASETMPEHLLTSDGFLFAAQKTSRLCLVK